MHELSTKLNRGMMRIFPEICHNFLHIVGTQINKLSLLRINLWYLCNLLKKCLGNLGNQSQVSAWQSATLLPISSKLVQPEEPV